MEMGALGWEHGDGRVGQFFSGCLLSKALFFDKNVYYLTLPMKSGRGAIIDLVVCFQTLFSVFVRALGWKHQDGNLGTGEDGSIK